MDYDFSKIPVFKDTPESFDILSDQVSGRIPVTRIEHWRELADVLNSSFFNQEAVESVFRGHRRYDWALMPTLARVSDNGAISRELANDQLKRFKQAIRGRINDHSLVEDNALQEQELWAVGQHHGLMTPLLDWTYSPYVALFFAFSKDDVKEEDDNYYRAIYILNKSFISDDDLCQEIPVVEPTKDDHGRLVNQAGLFTFSPYDSTIENTLSDILFGEDFSEQNLNHASESEQAGILARYICKVYIRNIDRLGCIKHLRQMNVHHASLFPDLIGASEFCNELIAEKYSKLQKVDDSYWEKLAAIESTNELDLSETIEGLVTKDLNVDESDTQDDVGTQDDDSSTGSSKINFIPDESSLEMLLMLKDSSVDKATRRRVTKLIHEILIDNSTLNCQGRENAKAKARNSIRAVMRKYSYSITAREDFLKELFVLHDKGVVDVR